MKKYLFFAVSALALAACSEKPGYVITGSVSNNDLNGKYVYLYQAPFRNLNEKAIDSTLVENNTFSFQGTTDSVKACVIVVPNGESRPKTINFVLENAPLTATFNESVVSVAGCPENDALTTFNQKVEELQKLGKAIAEDLKSEDKAVVEDAKKREASLDQQQSALYKNFVQQNLNNLSGAIVLSQCFYYLDDKDLIEITDNMGEAFKSHPSIERIQKIAEVRKAVAVGKKFTDFEMANAKGETHKLSEYVGNGKVVLIDFWASWCPPCRAEMPSLVKAYKTYKNKGFEIVGISLDSKADAWEKGVKDLNITWTQLSDLKGWKNEGAALYGVNSIPHTILVDKDGTIIAKNLHGQELEDKIKEVLNK